MSFTILFILFFFIIFQGLSKRHNSEQSRRWGVLSRRMWKQATGPRDQSGDCPTESSRIFKRLNLKFDDSEKVIVQTVM